MQGPIPWAFAALEAIVIANPRMPSAVARPNERVRPALRDGAADAFNARFNCFELIVTSCDERNHSQTTYSSTAPQPVRRVTGRFSVDRCDRGHRAPAPINAINDAAGGDKTVPQEATANPKERTMLRKL